MKILAIPGSLRQKSLNTSLLHAFAEEAQGHQVEIASLADIPLYSGDLEAAGIPEAVSKLGEAIRSADAVVISTPEYNYSIPGGLKNAIDWISRLPQQPFAGKRVGLMGASMGMMGTSRAQYHLRQVFVYLDGRVINKPEVFVSAAHTKFDEQGKLTDEGTRKLLGQMATALQG
jgi:chromate reductase